MLCILQQANLLLMDSVAGVGYSYSLDSNDYITNDTQAQTDMEATLRTWFKTYPYFANHSVILEGTLYAVQASYVPFWTPSNLRAMNELYFACRMSSSGYLCFTCSTHLCKVMRD